MKNDSEFTNAQLERIDIIENAAFDFIKVLTEQSDMKWDYSIIGELADIAADCLVNRGYRVRYPAIVQCANGDKHIVDYHNED